MLGLWDLYPVSDRHALLVTKRHTPDWWSATAEEQLELVQAVEFARRAIEAERKPDGFNVGINVGAAAGQTIFHLHVHVIPRYRGDVDDPRGGVRGVIPAKGNYLATRGPEAAREIEPAFKDRGHLVRGGERDPLLESLRAHIDLATRVDVAVAFVQESGVALVEEHLRDLLRRGGRLRFLTGDYLQISDPKALRRLLDLAAAASTEQVELRVYEARTGTFHPKAYVFHEPTEAGVAYVGSSNLTRAALTSGVEWNYRVVTSRERAGFSDVVAAFEELFRSAPTRPLDEAWVRAYEARRPAAPTNPAQLAFAPVEPAELPEPPPPPHEVQIEALEALATTRSEGNRAGLVVLATGLGKTWLAAFDSVRGDFKRVLFVAHREEILAQALKTFRRIRPNASLGFYNGAEKVPHADVVFASIQTLGRRQHRERFDPDAFDYIVIDEFHHAAARSYRELIARFEPEFLLGLTATPERTDGGNLLALCGENLVYRCNVPRGIERGLLCPFHYFGVPDNVDYAQIPWRNGRVDEEELTKQVATTARAQNALEQHRARAGKRTLAFCCSQRHADFMARFFTEAGLRAVAVHAGSSSAPRATSLEQLRDGKLDVVFAVDMFNEGVDVPSIDTVLMLRPTESRIVWQQQFGRGLRKDAGKDHVTVIDYIGNHRTFLVNVQALLNLPTADAPVIERALTDASRGALDLPPGCEVTYDLEAVDILRALLPAPGEQQALKAYLETFEERTGTRPRAVEAYHDGYNPAAARNTYGSWLELLRSQDKLSPVERAVLDQPDCGAFLRALDRTQMERSYKMLLLLSVLNADAFPGELAIEDLTEGFARAARRSRVLQADVGPDHDDPRKLRAMLERNPINAWVGGKGTGGRSYFSYSGDRFRTRLPELPDDQRATLQELTRELAEWRLAAYLDRPSAPRPDEGELEGGIVCKVNHAGGRPIVFPLPRREHPELPKGWTRLIANNDPHQANLVEQAINVVRIEGSDENVLGEILRGWFGPDAGLPGTNHHVRLTLEGDAVRMEPVERRPQGQLEVGATYTRQKIPEILGVAFSATVWNQGFISTGRELVLLVNLDKSDLGEDHNVPDGFTDPSHFTWHSQNRTRQSDKHGRLLHDHDKLGIPVHLFVRKERKTKGMTAPFFYCGRVIFESWKGEKPIVIQWRLERPLPPALYTSLTAAEE